MKNQRPLVFSLSKIPVLIFILFAPLWSTAEIKAPPEKPKNCFRVEMVRCQVTLTSHSNSHAAQATTGDEICQKDRLKLGAHSYVQFAMPGGHTFSAGPKTDIAFEEIRFLHNEDRLETRLLIDQGHLRAQVKSSDRVLVQTQDGEVAPIKAVDFIISKSSPFPSALTVLRGEALFSVQRSTVRTCRTQERCLMVAESSASNKDKISRLTETELNRVRGRLAPPKASIRTDPCSDPS